jgi:hypothetical protein
LTRVKQEDRSDEGSEKKGDDADVDIEREEPSKKRAREDDAAGTEELPSKRLDHKEEVSADTS